MEKLTLLDLRGEFRCNQIINCFIEQDLKFGSFGNSGFNYTLASNIMTEMYMTVF